LDNVGCVGVFGAISLKATKVLSFVFTQVLHLPGGILIWFKTTSIQSTKPNLTEMHLVFETFFGVCQ